MKTIRENAEINLEQNELFDLMHDYSRRLEWDPYLTEAYLMNGAKEAELGVSAYCKNHSNSVMITEYITFNKPTVAAIKMIKGPMILKKFSGAWNIKKISDQYSLLIFTYNFELKGGLIGKLLLPIASYCFAKEMRKRLMAIKGFVGNKK